MATYIAALLIFGLAIGGMALGVIFQGRRLQGSCGGTGLDCTCDALAARSCPLRKEREAV